MRLLLLIDCLNQTGGVETFLSAVVPEMEKHGAECKIATRLSHTPDNPHVRVLLGNDWANAFPHIGPFDFYRRNWVVDFFILLIFPIFFLISILDVIIRKRKLIRSMIGVRGRINDTLANRIPAQLLDLPLQLFTHRIIKKFKPDAIFVYRADGTRFLPIVLKFQIPVIYVEALEPEAVKKFPELKEDYDRLGKCIQAVGAVVTQSIRVKKQLGSHYDVHTKTVVVPWTPLVTKNSITKSRNNNSLTVGTASRLSPEKGMEILIRAASILRKAFPDLQFLIAGGGPSESELRQLSKSLNMDDVLEFSGQYDPFLDLDKILNRLDIYVLPSYTEGAPVSILEAMAYGKPVIATDVAGTPEVVLNECTGLIIPPGDINALSQAIERLIVDPSLREKMGKAGHDRYEKNYSPPIIAKQYLALANDVIILKSNTND